MTNYPVKDLYAPHPPEGGPLDLRDFQVARHSNRGPAHESVPVRDGSELDRWEVDLVCFDGHVERSKLDDLWEFYWHRD